MNINEYCNNVIKESFSKISLDFTFKSLDINTRFNYMISDIIMHSLILRWYTSDIFISAQFLREIENGRKGIGQALSQAVMNYDYSNYNNNDLKAKLLNNYFKESESYVAILNSFNTDIMHPNVQNKIASEFAKICGFNQNIALTNLGRKNYADVFNSLRIKLSNSRVTFG